MLECGSAETAARAFGTGWVFLPIGALIAAAGLTWSGHGGRLTFAVMTLLFIGSAVVILVHGFVDPVVSHGRAPVTGPQGSAWLAVVLSFPVAMTLATGTEAPATAMAQLGQLGPADRRRFARTTIALTLLIVAGLTIGLTELAVRLHVGIPKANSTQIADIAHAATGKGAVYVLFQVASALLLLAAASSSFQAGPGLLKALSRHPRSAGVGSCHAASARRTATTRPTGRSSSTCSCPRASLSPPPVGSRSWCSSTRWRCS